MKNRTLQHIASGGLSSGMDTLIPRGALLANTQGAFGWYFLLRAHSILPLQKFRSKEKQCEPRGYVPGLETYHLTRNHWLCGLI